MDEQEAGRSSHLFTVRLWREQVDGGTEVRGNVRDVVGGAFLSFRSWPDMTAFMVARMEEDAGVRAGHGEGGT